LVGRVAPALLLFIENYKNQFILFQGVGMDSKKCSKCGIVKSKTEFSVSGVARDGLSYLCKKCAMSQSLVRERTKKGLIAKIFRTQKTSSKQRSFLVPSYTKKELIDWFFKQNDFDFIYQNWVNSGYKKELRPSVDRIDDYKGYSFENIQLMTWGENLQKSYEDRKSGRNRKGSLAVVQYDMNMVFIGEYYSCREAARASGIDASTIVKCCKKKCNSIGGYKWEYKDTVVNKQCENKETIQ
jgi:hypothetical protein